MYIHALALTHTHTHSCNCKLTYCIVLVVLQMLKNRHTLYCLPNVAKLPSQLPSPTPTDSSFSPTPCHGMLYFNYRSATTATHATCPAANCCVSIVPTVSGLSHGLTLAPTITSTLCNSNPQLFYCISKRFIYSWPAEEEEILKASCTKYFGICLSSEIWIYTKNIFIATIAANTHSTDTATYITWPFHFDPLAVQFSI